MITAVAALVASGLTAFAPSAPASAAGAVQLRFVTANINFDADQSVVRDKWRNLIAPNADVVFLQEAKNVRLSDFVETSTWIIRHGTSAAEDDSEDKLGSALLIRRAVATEVADYGLVKGVDASPCPRGGIMTRWLAKIKVKLTNGRWIRVASLHMPPLRCQTGPGGPYDRMADSVVAFADLTDMPTVLGADWNKVVDDDPNAIGRRSGLEPNGPDLGERIDGFMYSPRLRNCCLTQLGLASRGHPAVQVKLTVPAP
ncbi:endonuclease/exonuclease/phosphatase family protein [Saccharothrix sp. BKS2]|uniref:endonuclease/exonuclease/phosphatase family protein n=1 Tax=Saccharothrix sp. BKS2 TaxID=3064400 RepID=UPI0039ED8B8B